MEFEATTPPYDKTIKKIASELKCDEKLIVIRNIYTKFGSKKADFLAYAYSDEKSMKNIEAVKKEGKEVKKAEEKPADKPQKTKEKKEEKPKDEKKEDKKE